MTIEEVTQAISQYEKQIIGKKLGDAGHKIQGFGIDLISKDNYELYVLGQDLRSYVSIVKKPLNEWLNENNF